MLIRRSALLRLSITNTLFYSPVILLNVLASSLTGGQEILLFADDSVIT